MKVDMLMPQMGESITEATILRWLVKEGDKVEKDQTILEISTDKVDSEIPAPASGVVSEICFNEGDVVPVKAKIAVIDTEGKDSTVKHDVDTSSKGVEEAKEQREQVSASPVEERISTNDEPQETKRFISPLVKTLAKKYNISQEELHSITGSGVGGRVTKEDIMEYVRRRNEEAESTVTAKEPKHIEKEPPKERFEVKEESRGVEEKALVVSSDVEVVPMDNMRMAIAEHMVRSKRTSPHVYSVQEVDVSKISAWRRAKQEEFLNREGFKLSYTPFFLEAAVKGLLEYPEINASVEGNAILIKKHINLGCAVALGTKGLIVPVIKRAEEKNLVGLARALNDLANRARNKKLMPDDVANGTFTVTNPGVFGTVIGFPIINQPQLAILSLGAIKKRPVVINDAIAIREMVYLTLSYDHRVIDGSLGGSFLRYIKEYLEGWDENRTLY